jgi:hypothetical protein
MNTPSLYRSNANVEKESRDNYSFFLEGLVMPSMDDFLLLFSSSVAKGCP